MAGKPRGASTITQQLVRARLLPAWAFEGTTYERKLREIIQSIRLTDAYPGEAGKKQIITAYLNQNFYGNGSYGVQAAAKGYFNKPMKDLTLAQFALLAAIPQSPTKFDLMNNVEEVCLDKKVVAPEDCVKVKLLVPDTTEVAVRRDYILDLMKTRSTLTGDKYTTADYDAAKAEEIVLTPPPTTNWKAAHFVWQVRETLSAIVCPDTPTDCPRVDTGGYRVTTTLDWKMQQKVEKWVFAAARAPNCQEPTNGPAQPQDPDRRVGLDPGPARPSHQERGRRRHRLSDRRSPRVRRQRELQRPRATRSSSRSSTCCPTAFASRGRPSSPSTTSSASMTAR